MGSEYRVSTNSWCANRKTPERPAIGIHIRKSRRPLPRPSVNLHYKYPFRNMSYNKVISSKVIKTFNVGGKAIQVQYATETSTWECSFLAQGVQDEPCEALKKARDVPAGAPIAILA
ncbi:hypothetical protein PMIN06_011907 [Paraphaeosphaeria minitans]